MEKNNKKNILIVLMLVIIITVILGILFWKNINKNNKENWENPYTDINKDDIQYQNSASVDELKQKTGLTGDSELYQIETEYDGRRVLNIKADIQYKVAFAGIIKGKKPGMNELDDILDNNHPDKDGVWVDTKIKDKFLQLLKSSTNSEYEINEEGYLEIKNKNVQNDNDKKLENLINGNRKIIITISKMYYEVDSVTGEIVEYPFEQLDNYQTCDKIQSDNNIIIVITSNSKSKLTNSEIIEDVLQNAL